MPKVANFEETLAGLNFLHGRRPDMDEEKFDNVFACLSDYRDGGIYFGSFDGESQWERHRNGDEVVQIIKGETDVKVLVGDTVETLSMKAGELTVVPKGAWHKFIAPNGVTVMTVTPSPTDQSFLSDPRNEPDDV
ncbi:MAG: cupin domain-containing protein [Alphaproteobacteria bacterium]|nr:cupin domain-containing protein [Alphaproteobacteria bacterium]